MWCFSVFQCSSSLIKSSFCPPYPSASESYSFISRIFPLDTCQNKEYGLCISFILLYIRSLSHLNVEPHQRADLWSTASSALHLGGKSRSTGLLWLLLNPGLCPCSCCATRARGSLPRNRGSNNLGNNSACWKSLLGGQFPLLSAFIELQVCFCSMAMMLKWLKLLLWQGVELVLVVCIVLWINFKKTTN